jgi:hypothetical protein
MPQQVQCPTCGQPYEIDHDMVGEAFFCECKQAYEVAADLSLVAIQLRPADEAVPQARPQQLQQRPAHPSKKKKANKHIFLWIFLVFGLGAIVAAGVMMVQVNKKEAAAKAAKAAKLAQERAAVAATPVVPGEKKKLTLTLDGNAVTDAAATKTIEAPEPSVDELPVDWQVVPDPSSASWAIPDDFSPTNFPTANHLLLSNLSSPFVVALTAGEVEGIYTYTLYDVSKGAVVKQVESPLSPYLQMEDCALSPDGKYLAREESQGSLKGIRIWDGATGSPIHLFPDVADGAKVLFQGFSDAEHIVVVYGSNPRKIRRTNVAKQEEVNAFEMPQLSGRDARAKQIFAISPGGAFLAVLTRGARGLVSIYNLETGELAGMVKTGEGSNDCSPEGLAFSDAGTSLAALVRRDGRDFFITGWNVENGQVIAEAGPIAAREVDLPENVSPVLWLQDSSGWVVSGRVVLDRAGQVLQTLDAVNAARRDVRVAGGRRLVRFAQGAPSLKVLELE